MRKQLRLLAIIGAVVVLLGAALGVLVLTQPEQPEESSAPESSDTSIELLTVKRADKDDTYSLITEAVVTYDGETYTLQTNDDGQLYVKGYEALPIETYSLSSFESAVTSISAIQEITGTGNDADYGLDKPVATADITYYDGTKATLTLGAAAPQNAGYYFRLSGKDGIYLVDSTAAGRLMQPSVSYIGTTLMTAPVVKEEDKNAAAVLRDVSLKGPGLDREYSYRIIADDDGDTYFSTYVLTYPYKRGTNSNKLDDSILYATSLGANMAVKPFPTDEDLKKYGLDAPSITATIHTAVKNEVTVESSEEDGEDQTVTEYYNVQEHTFRLSAVTDGYFYALVDDIDCIYQISTLSLPWATLSYEDCVTPLLFLKNISTVSAMSFTYEGKTTQIALTHYPDEEDSDKSMIATVDGKAVKTSNIRAFYQVLLGINRAGAAPEEPTGDAEILFTYTDLDTNETTEIEIFKHSASVYIGRFDGGDIFKIRASEIDTLLKQYQNLVDGKDVLLG